METDFEPTTLIADGLFCGSVTQGGRGEGGNHIASQLNFSSPFQSQSIFGTRLNQYFGVGKGKGTLFLVPISVKVFLELGLTNILG